MRPSQNLYSKLILLGIVLVAILLAVIGGLIAGWDFSVLISEQAQAAYAITVAIGVGVFAWWVYNRRV